MDIGECGIINNDYWRHAMYLDIQRVLPELALSGTGIEFGGTNRVIQQYCPNVTFDVREYPQYDILNHDSWSDCDVMVADQILEHVSEPWKVFEHAAKYVRKAAIITVPFLIGIHPCPDDFWRMTPSAIRHMAENAGEWANVYIGTWGSTAVNNWHSLYNDSQSLINNISEQEWRCELEKNDPAKPFVIWAILSK